MPPVLSILHQALALLHALAANTYRCFAELCRIAGIACNSETYYLQSVFV
jgi:hypothetical protein